MKIAEQKTEIKAEPFSWKRTIFPLSSAGAITIMAILWIAYIKGNPIDDQIQSVLIMIAAILIPTAMISSIAFPENKQL